MNQSEDLDDIVSLTDKTKNLEPAYLRRALAEVDAIARRHPSTIRVVRAPGRVNLIGEHTDYNDGLVMPAAIGMEIRIAYTATVDRRVELTLLANGERAGFDLDALGPRRGTWIDYVAAMAWSLQQAGLSVAGFRGVLASTLPISAGLSSSAALELASAWALAGDRPPAMEAVELARAAQRGENEYVGVRCGLMDQFASANGQAGKALLFDCRSLEWRSLPIPKEVRLLVCHTGSSRRLEASEYNARRAECERAVAIIARHHPGVGSLRDVSTDVLERCRRFLDSVAFRRAQHVVAENARVPSAEAALKAGDLVAIGRLFAESHTSLRDNYEVSSPELEALVDIASETPGVVATRMTGAGFGGCTISLVRPEAVGQVREEVERRYPLLTGRTPSVWEVEAVAGAGEVVG